MTYNHYFDFNILMYLAIIICRFSHFYFKFKFKNGLKLTENYFLLQLIKFI